MIIAGSMAALQFSSLAVMRLGTTRFGGACEDALDVPLARRRQIPLLRRIALEPEPEAKLPTVLFFPKSGRAPALLDLLLQSVPVSNATILARMHALQPRCTPERRVGIFFRTAPLQHRVAEAVC